MSKIKKSNRKVREMFYKKLNKFYGKSLQNYLYRRKRFANKSAAKKIKIYPAICLTKCYYCI